MAANHSVLSDKNATRVERIASLEPFEAEEVDSFSFPMLQASWAIII
jgi:hypothetical protein